MRNFVLALLAVAYLAACGRDATPASVGADWVVRQQPIVAIADSSVPQGHEFNGISSARRLRDLAILVANAGASELALFDSLGQFRRAIGRKGQGPGEYQGPLSVFAWRADSIVVYDPATVRWTILSPALVVSRTTGAPDPTILQPTWLYQGAMVNDGVTDSTSKWMLDVLTEIRNADPEFRRIIRARRGDDGTLWIRDSLNDRRWEAYTGPGQKAGSIALPVSLEVLQFGYDFALGLLRDSLGVEELRVYQFARPSAGVGVSQNLSSALPSDSAMLVAFPNVLMAQEIFYADHAHYTAHADSLQLKSPFPARLVLLEADSRHWTGIGIRPETGATCGLSIGWPAPVGWRDGTPFCGR